MVYGLILSAITIGVSALLESSGNIATRDGSSSRTSSSMMRFSFGHNLSDSHRIFLSGAVLGIGVSVLMSSLNAYFRILPSVRVFWRFMSNTDETKELFPYRIPASAKDCSKGQASRDCLLLEEGGQMENGNDSKQQQQQAPTLVRTLVNPSMAVTAHLHVQYMTLPPYFELPPTKSRGVEFYYVISGSGVLSQQGIPERQPLTAGDCCVVDALRMRWIKNTCGGGAAMNADLVVLRASDGPCEFDRIRKDPNHRSVSRLEAPATMIANGLRALQNKANQYYYSSSSSGSGTAETTPSQDDKMKDSSSKGASAIYGQRSLHAMSQ